MILRCVIDGLLLHAEVIPGRRALVAWDGPESFEVEALETLFYEVISATTEEMRQLQEAHYRLLRPSDDFETAPRPALLN
jgi:hypothetical protein